MRLKPLLAATAGLAALAAGSAAAQNSADPVTVPPVEVPAPPPPPPAAPAPAPAPPSVVVPSAPPPPAPVTIDPDAAYPNGFADPLDPNATNLSLGYQEQDGGFDWGLLGLLGLFGLIPLFRDRGTYARRRYVEYEDEPRRTTTVRRTEEHDRDV